MADREHKPLGETIREYVDAGYPGLWVQSYEQEDAVTEIATALRGGREPFAHVYQWDSAARLQRLHDITSDGTVRWVPLEEGATFEDALAFVEHLGIPPADDPGMRPERICLLVKNPDFATTGPRTQQVLNYLPRAETFLRQRLIALSFEPSPPKQWEKAFQPVQHHLPRRERLRELLALTATEDGELPENATELAAIADAARGMTEAAAKNAFSLCLVRDGCVTARPVFEEKARALESGDLGLALHKSTATFYDIVGLNHVKQVYREMMAQRSRIRENPRLRPRGIVLAGLPGTGKSLFCAAAGRSVVPSRPVVCWSISETGSKWVSEGAHKMRQVIETLKALAPCDVQVDEGFKGRGGSSGDPGGGARQESEMQAIWLKEHQEMIEDVYPIFTANQEIITVANNQPETLARFDAVFYLDYPTKAQLVQLWKYHLSLYGLIEHGDEYADMAARGDVPDDAHWVGRDVDNCCRQAALRGRPPVGVPIAPSVRPGSDVVGKLREAAERLGWLSAEYEDRYQANRHGEHMQQLTGGRDVVRAANKKKKKKSRRPASTAGTSE